MRRIFALAALAAAALNAQQPGLMRGRELEAAQRRSVQLVESTAAAVPGLARAAAPIYENARQTLLAIESGPSGDPGQLYDLVNSLRSYLSLADSVPKPNPFPEEARKQFAELRETADRLHTHFRARLDQVFTQARPADPDNLSRYAEENARLPRPSADRKRVIFYGDSITDFWRLNEYFPNYDFVNRGISGQVTSEMLGRMKADVIDLAPAAVLILAGTNDISRGTPLSAIEHNLVMMADLADAYRIKPLFASVLPVSDYHKAANPRWEVTRLRPPAKILELNQWIQAFCRQRNYAYVDYFPQLVDPAGQLKAEYGDDGLHPNAAGYRIMAPVALAALNATVLAPPAPVTKRRGRQQQQAQTPPVPVSPPVTAAAPVGAAPVPAPPAARMAAPTASAPAAPASQPGAQAASPALRTESPVAPVAPAGESFPAAIRAPSPSSQPHTPAAAAAAAPARTSAPAASIPAPAGAPPVAQPQAPAVSVPARRVAPTIVVPASTATSLPHPPAAPAAPAPAVAPAAAPPASAAAQPQAPAVSAPARTVAPTAVAPASTATSLPHPSAAPAAPAPAVAPTAAAPASAAAQPQAPAVSAPARTVAPTAAPPSPASTATSLPHTPVAPAAPAQTIAPPAAAPASATARTVAPTAAAQATPADAAPARAESLSAVTSAAPAAATDAAATSQTAEAKTGAKEPEKKKKVPFWRRTYPSNPPPPRKPDSE